MARNRYRQRWSPLLLGLWAPRKCPNCPKNIAVAIVRRAAVKNTLVLAKLEPPPRTLRIHKCPTMQLPTVKWGS